MCPERQLIGEPKANIACEVVAKNDVCPLSALLISGIETSVRRRSVKVQVCDSTTS
jgi:hypothetical protein